MKVLKTRETGQSKPNLTYFRLGLFSAPRRRTVPTFPQRRRSNHIPFQTDPVVRYGEGVSSIQKIGRGVPVINFVVPAEYTHANTGIIDRADFYNAVWLPAAVLKRFDPATAKDPANIP